MMPYNPVQRIVSKHLSAMFVELGSYQTVEGLDQEDVADILIGLQYSDIAEAYLS